MTTLMSQYNAAIACGDISDDPLQRDLLRPMQRLVDELSKSRSSWFYPLFKHPIRGIYLYGSVGVGKTYLIDLLYDCVDDSKKARLHFHHFMQQIDAQLRQLQGQKNPLRTIAKNLAKSTRLICLDEFMVHDVAYAMILAELVQVLFVHGVVLVISSNTAPDDLYLNGVHRERFLPAIAAIKKYCEVLSLHERRDYRVGRAPQLNSYLFPLNEHTAGVMKQQFMLLAPAFKEEGMISIQNREISYFKKGERAIWFAFDVLCNLPRSQLDYLEIADKFDVIFLDNIPALSVNHTVQAIMFIHFIDVMYDCGIKVVISAAVPAEELYLEGEMKEAFKRTLSRLLEMQSADYLARHPKRKLGTLGVNNSEKL